MTKKEVKTTNGNITDETLPVFCVIFAVFIGGLILNTIIGTKIVDIFGFYMPAGIFLWSLTFPLTDIVTETYGKRYALYFVLCGFIVAILSLIMISFALWLPAAPFWQNTDAFNTVLGANIRTILAMLASFVVTQTLDIYLFDWIKQKTKARFLWLRNNLSTFTSQFLANCLFLSIAFWGTIPTEAWISLFITNMIGRVTLAMIDTPIVYLGVYGLKKIYPTQFK